MKEEAARGRRLALEAEAKRQEEMEGLAEEQRVRLLEQEAAITAEWKQSFERIQQEHEAQMKAAQEHRQFATVSRRRPSPSVTATVTATTTPSSAANDATMQRSPAGSSRREATPTATPTTTAAPTPTATPTPARKPTARQYHQNPTATTVYGGTPATTGFRREYGVAQQMVDASAGSLAARVSDLEATFRVLASPQPLGAWPGAWPGAAPSSPYRHRYPQHWALPVPSQVIHGDFGDFGVRPAVSGGRSAGGTPSNIAGYRPEYLPAHHPGSSARSSRLHQTVGQLSSPVPLQQPAPGTGAGTGTATPLPAPAPTRGLPPWRRRHNN